jgi:hypothetical protein
LHARHDQVGKTMQCHDCHSVNEIRPPVSRTDSADRPTLTDTYEFRMSDPGDRPKYSSLEQQRPGQEEDDEEEEFRVAPDPVSDQPPSPPSSAQPMTTGAASQASAASQSGLTDDGLVDIFSSSGHSVPVAPSPALPAGGNQPPPAPPSAGPAPYVPGQFKPKYRLGPQGDPLPGSSAPPPPPTYGEPKPPPIDLRQPPRYNPKTGAYESIFPEERKKSRVRKHADSYGDELWSPARDASRPRFHSSPFMVGIVEFLFYPTTTGRWLGLTALAIVPIAFLAMSIGTGVNMAGVASGFLATVTGIVWLAMFGVHLQSIVEETGRGADSIEKWPLGGIFPRSNPLYLPICAALAAVPGFVGWILFYVSSEGASVRGYMILLVSIMFCLPPLWLPILVHRSPFGAHQSPAFLESFRYSGDGWIVFSIFTLLLAFIACIGIALWEVGNAFVAPFSAALLVTPLILYARLLGRLLWYIDPDMAPPPLPPKTAPTPLPDTVDPTQLHRS